MKLLTTILLFLGLTVGVFAQGVFYENSSSAWVSSATHSSVVYALGGAPTVATDGTDVAVDDGDRHISEIMIPYRMTITGIFYMVGSVGGTDSVIVDLYNSAGVLVTGGSSITSAGDAEVLVSASTATFQKVPFDGGTITIDPGTYYISATFDGTTAKYRAYVVAGSPFVALTTAGTFGTAASITPGTTFTASEGIIGGVY